MVKATMRLLGTSCWCQGEGMNALMSAVMHLLLLVAVILSCQGCPDKCTCSMQTVKCQNKDLGVIPLPIPVNTTFLWITGNNISNISEDSFPTRLELLTDLYLSGNEMEAVEEMVFHNLPNLERLDLSNNNIQMFSEKAFPDESKLQVLNLSRSFHNHSSVSEVLNILQSGNLLQLTVLDLSDNDLVLLPDGIFTSLSNLVNVNLQNSSIISISSGILKVPPLRELDLRDNSLRNLPTNTLTEFNLKSDLRVRLAGNPWRCDCFIVDMLVWLKNSTQVTDMKSLTCADPARLSRRPLVQVEQSQLKCSGNMEGVLETSYVFLGLVLALIGVIFLLVLYLNRKGIKRWMYNIRDACRDHMEGYHYRYEINSDPRLANLSINSDV
ncbi:trophoblast glycoprotein b [Dunckerocampus dactyliophorus]|uniref:trophoblast glycoprotein b n=1 Tax=Dunckerocampus dactyliophorus TaxID=161453 RepID=UPI002406A106|nr:trophoblast glycoprotein b [Dunckerocampus dactyliophorus]